MHKIKGAGPSGIEAILVVSISTILAVVFIWFWVDAHKPTFTLKSEDWKCVELNRNNPNQDVGERG